MFWRYAIPLAALSMLGGCFFTAKKPDGGDKTVINTTAGGKMTIDNDKDGDSGTMTIESGDGKITYEADDDGVTTTTTTPDGETLTSEWGNADNADIFRGLMYPGAKMKEDASMSMNTPDGSNDMIVLLTGDDAERIADWYKDKWEDASTYTSNETAMVNAKDGDTHWSMTASEKDGETTITLSRVIRKS